MVRLVAIPSVISTCVLIHKTHMLVGFGGMGREHMQHSTVGIFFSGSAAGSAARPSLGARPAGGYTTAIVLVGLTIAFFNLLSVFNLANCSNRVSQSCTSKTIVQRALPRTVCGDRGDEEDARREFELYRWLRCCLTYSSFVFFFLFLSH